MHYKDLENKQVTIGDFLNKENAIIIYRNSKEKFIENQNININININKNQNQEFGIST